MCQKGLALAKSSGSNVEKLIEPMHDGECCEKTKCLYSTLSLDLAGHQDLSYVDWSFGYRAGNCDDILENTYV
jgi:hypothetical protein